MSAAVACDWAIERAAAHARLDEEDRRIAAALTAAGLDRHAAATTPRQVAEHLIMAYVARGDTAEDLAHGGLGGGDRESWAQIGGWAACGDTCRKRYDCWHILVTCVNGRDLAAPAVLGLRALYDDLYRRMHEGRQLPLFAEVTS